MSDRSDRSDRSDSQGSAVQRPTTIYLRHPALVVVRCLLLTSDEHEHPSRARTSLTRTVKSVPVDAVLVTVSDLADY